MKSPDIVIIGGGIIGLATAYQLITAHPQKSVLLLEKESQLARHQSGRNSGVLHAGIYYAPGSLKAITCRTGRRAMEEFCRWEGIEYRICGKVIVAVEERELAGLHTLYERGRANGLNCQLIGRSRLRELEPHAAGIRAIYVPETGITDFARVCACLAGIITRHGYQVLTGVQVINLREKGREMVVITTAGDFLAGQVINCAGLYSDRVAAMAAGPAPVKIIPFRGEYYQLNPAAESWCRALIYPVPDPRFPFLGVHFTRKISGEVKCGPNAVLALAREGYQKSCINFGDVWDSLTFPGFARLARRYWRTGLDELWRSVSKPAFVGALQRLVPAVTAQDLRPYPAGVRAQAVTPQGRLLDDFAITVGKKMINVLNAPSPGATASLSIGQMVVERLSQQFS